VEKTMKHLKAFARNAKPFIEEGVTQLKPALKRARISSENLLRKAIKTHKVKTDEAKKNLAPLRRKIKAKMKTIDAVKKYATDANINMFFDVVMNLMLAYVIQTLVTIMFRGVFGRKTLRPVPHHVRSKSVEFRPLSPERDARPLFTPR
jgi:hypothetical protein